MTVKGSMINMADRIETPEDFLKATDCAEIKDDGTVFVNGDLFIDNSGTKINVVVAPDRTLRRQKSVVSCVDKLVLPEKLHVSGKLVVDGMEHALFPKELTVCTLTLRNMPNLRSSDWTGKLTAFGDMNIENCPGLLLLPKESDLHRNLYVTGGNPDLFVSPSQITGAVFKDGWLSTDFNPLLEHVSFHHAICGLWWKMTRVLTQ